MKEKADPRTADLREGLRFRQEIGVEFVLAGEGRARPRRAAACPAPSETGLAPGGRSLEDVAEEIRACRKCGLAATRTLAVPGEGNPRAEVMFVGEGPGHDEDVQGRPFVGRAGQLLTKIIAAMTFDRSEVFIANIVKCRPPENRVPHREEAAACAPYLLEQIRAIRPKVIVALGKSAAEFFIPSAAGMTSLRGRLHEWRGFPVMPTFHPSYLVRNEGNRELKRLVWDDMRRVMALLGRL